MNNNYRRAWTGTGLRIGLLLLVYTLLRLIFYACHHSHFPDARLSYFLYGMRFDLSAIAYLNFPWIVIFLLPFDFFRKKAVQIGCDIYFVSVNSIALLSACIDIGYFPYVSKRLTADVFSYLGNAQFDFKALLPLFLSQFWLLLLAWIALISLLAFCCKKVRLKPETAKGNNRRAAIFRRSGGYTVGLFLLLTAMRGGWQLRPLNLISAGNYASPQYLPLVLNTPFTLLRTVGKNTIDDFRYFPELQQAEALYSPVHTQYLFPGNLPSVKNVVLIVMEGLSQEMFAFYHAKNPDYPQYCPFLDSIASRSIAFNGIANGRRTMEGIPSIVCGIPSLMEHAYIETPFVQNHIQSPVEILSKAGFHTCFFHGGENGSMNFESFCRSIGYQDYYGMNEYPHPEDYDGHWGIPDRSYLRYMAGKLHGMRQPFFATVLTLSSHHPFQLPKDAGNFDYPQGTHPMHCVSAYTDRALREFFQILSRESWFDSTLFILTADHAYEGSSTFSQNPYGNYQIPLLFHHPAAPTFNERRPIMQQTDIMPSLFACLQLQQPLLCFGQNAFDSARVPTAFNYLSGTYQLYYEHYLLQYNGQEVTGFYDLDHDPLLKHDLKKEKLPIQAAALRRLQAVLQSYSYRMRNNCMRMEEGKTRKENF